MNQFQWLVISISVGYLIILFTIAFFVERKKYLSDYIKNSSTVYALSLAIYCTAWTFYGSIGSASKSGIMFLPIYLGPTLIMPIWYILMQKINRISKINNITTLADFLSIRYSNSINLGMYITLLIIIGIIPYISLQIKAISESFKILISYPNTIPLTSTPLNIPLIVTLIMGVFIIIFATQKMESNEHHTGLVASIAFESIFKLIAFIVAGITITFFIFDHPTDIYHKIMMNHQGQDYFTLKGNNSFSEWAGLSILSAIAIMLLPRQFQVAVIENNNETHFKSALWKFPLYLFLINLFVIPVALGGHIFLGGFNAPDYYLLEIPLIAHKKYISLLVFLGGFSAATAMIVIETVALSNMLSNNFLIPLILKLGNRYHTINDQIAQNTLLLRRMSVFIVLALTLFYYSSLSPLYSLVSIGLISFVFIAQFFPSFIGSLYLKQSNHKAVLVSISIGFSIWLYTLVLPSVIESTSWGHSIIHQGLFGISLLKPHSLFGLEAFSPVIHSFFWSMFFNLSTYIILSIFIQPTNYEKQQAHLYVDVYRYSAIEDSQVMWKEIATLSDIKALLIKFLGKDKTKIALSSFSKRYNISLENNLSSDPRLIPFVERLLSKFVGNVSARILVESVIKEKDIYINEMIDVIQESKEIITLNRELTKKSNELEKAKLELESINNRLILHDQTKNEFLATVSHELKSPLTSIRSLSEILQESQELTLDEISNFSKIINKESTRISRLINQLLDLEKYDTGHQKLFLHVVNIDDFLSDVEGALSAELQEKSIKLLQKIDVRIHEIIFDRDKMVQVFINLISNAIKFSNEGDKIIVEIQKHYDHYKFMVTDFGKGIEKDYQELIFERFYQAKDQTIIKPKGSGLGLAICKKIVQLHKGKIYVDMSSPKGTIFAIEIPQLDY